MFVIIFIIPTIFVTNSYSFSYQNYSNTNNSTTIISIIITTIISIIIINTNIIFDIY